MFAIFVGQALAATHSGNVGLCAGRLFIIAF